MSVDQCKGRPSGADDGLGSFGGRAQGDLLDHRTINDGTGDNVLQLRGPKLEASRTRDNGDGASIDEVVQHAAYETGNDREEG